MPVPKSKPSTSKTPPVASHKKRILWLFPVVLICCVGFIISGQYQSHTAVKQDKLRYSKADDAMSVAYKDMIRQTDSPLWHKKTEYCSRVALKYTDGPISCTIRHSFIFGLQGRDQGLQMANALSQSLKAYSENGSVPEGVFQDPNMSVNKQEYISGSHNSMTCSLSFTSDTTANFYETRNYVGGAEPTSPFVGQYDYMCSSTVKRPLYDMNTPTSMSYTY